MSQDDSPKSPPRRIDVAAKMRFLAALRAGASRAEAAAGSGFCWRAFYQVRRRDPVFEYGWLAALELCGVDERDSRRAAAKLAERRGEGHIAPNNQRVLQLQRSRRGFKFTEKRRQIFLDHFAGTADEKAAADAAGVSVPTVRARFRTDPEFAALRDEALRLSYPLLEAEAVRQRLAAAERLRDNLEPKGELAQEFERVMKLLARYDRRDGRIAAREQTPSAGRAFSFEAAIVALDKALDAFGVRRGLIAPGGGGGAGGAGEIGPEAAG
jgi:hypothetical protein